MGFVYKVTSPSGKSYIGITTKTIQKRWDKHVEHAMGKRTAGVLYAAMRKYGPELFTREQIGEADDWDELCRMEVAAIASHGTLAPGGYNCTTGGEGVIGPRSEKTRAAVSAAQKRRFQDPEQREKLRLAGLKGNPPKPKVVKPPRVKKVKVKLTKDQVSERIKAGMKRPEVSAKVQAAAEQRAADPEWREKISATSKGRKMPPRSEKWKAMVAEMRKKEWSDPEKRAKKLAALAAAREARRQKKLQQQEQQ